MRAGVAHLRVAWFAPLGRFDGFASVALGFGEVRSGWVGPLASDGVASASSRFVSPGETPAGGSALPGYNLPGLSWRVSAVAPRSRTQVRAVGDGYVGVPDIVAHLLSLAPVVAMASAVSGDLSARFGGWSGAASGWSARAADSAQL